MGGLEQAFINTTEALTSHGHRVTALLHPQAPHRQAVAAHASAILMARPRGFYDLGTAWHLRGLLKKIRPDVILAHNARAISLLHTASRGLGIPICGISHSYKTARTTRADALIVLTEHMRQHFIIKGYPASRMTIIPNMIRLEEKPPLKPRSHPPVIGSIGRITIDKGYYDLLEACRILKERGVEFRAKIGGQGPELRRLREMNSELGLDGQVEWMGWVKDRNALYRDMDIYCLPSREESFGIVLLEAFVKGVPIIATSEPGPSAIITSGKDGLIVERNNPLSLADGLQTLIEQPGLGIRFATIGRQTVEQYEFDAIARLWNEAMEDIISATRQAQAA